jgi:DNA polymerase III subunit epsilon
MRLRSGAWLWVLAACASVLAVLAGGALLLYLSLDDEHRSLLTLGVAESAPLIAFGTSILLVVAAMAAHWLYRRHPHAARQLAEQSRSMLAAEHGFRVAKADAPDLADVASAINQLADAYHRIEHDLEQRSAETRAHVEEERDRFAALMSELSQGVLVCNADGRILLYNPRAAALLAPFVGSAARGDYKPLGLGRSVLALLDRNQVAHALDMIQQQLDHVERPHARFVTSVANGALLRVQVAPFLGAQRHVAGMVFTFDDVSALVGREAQRLRLLQSLATGVRAPAANLRAAAENLATFPDMPADQRTRFVDIAVAESRTLTDRLNTALRDYADALKGSLTLDDMRAVDLLAVVQRHISEALQLPTTIEDADAELWLRVDSYAIVQALSFLAARLAGDYPIRAFRLRAGSGGSFAEVDLIWTGAIVGSAALSLWEGEPMRIGADETPLSLRDVLERHGAEAWLQVDKIRQISRVRFLLPRGEAGAALAYKSSTAESRPEYYDFDLFDRLDPTGALAERRLSELSYTVFDTETTGLEPSAGDEIISMGAVRIVNGRLLKQEVFEQMVNPRRPISRESIAIHGIEARQLLNEPPIEQVLPRFHRFCEDTVLVAHNAAFDMRFLELKEAVANVRFGQPVLDTLLLSAVVHPSLDNHDLDTIAERLGVRVIGRHTALGDALLTADVFLRLLPLLAERGIVTLAQALEASRATYHARLQY